MSDDDTNPTETALDLLFYAPLGLALEVRELLPKLAERGRQQVGMAKVMGQFAVQQGQQLAEKRLGDVQKQATGILQLVGLWPQPATNGTSPADPAPAAASAPPAEAVTADAPAAENAPPAASLAIPDYDSLSASQVVPRLDGLSADELETVRRYEAARRGRKTILGKIGQLQG